MSKFPTLTEMGINNPGEIERYSLNTTNNIDVLRIVYKRKKGSLLPTSKRFEFGRASKTILADSGSRKTEIVHVISPFLQKAMNELEGIIGAKKSSIKQAKLVKQELQQLHQDMASRLTYIESLIDEM
jgi:ABC-type transport system involved in cytochrome bd biosynthesis fused ATPase/permease subunit